MALQAKFGDTSFKVGDAVRVTHKFQAGEKTQQQTFEGLVIAIKGREAGKTFTVRKIASDGNGVEKIWPLLSPNLVEITVKKPGRVRRAKLYYLRQRVGKQALATKAG